MSPGLRLKILERDGWRCWYCGCALPKLLGTDWFTTEFQGKSSRPVVDHKTPLIKSGDDSEENLCACCQSCNSQKRAMTVEEYREWLQLRTDPVTMAIVKLSEVLALLSTPYDDAISEAIKHLSGQRTRLLFDGEQGK